MYLDTPILSSASPRAVVGNRAALAEPEIVSPKDWNAILPGQVTPDGLGPPLGKLIVVGDTADVVGETSYL